MNMKPVKLNVLNVEMTVQVIESCDSRFSMCPYEPGSVSVLGSTDDMWEALNDRYKSELMSQFYKEIDRRLELEKD